MAGELAITPKQCPRTLKIPIADNPTIASLQMDDAKNIEH